MVLTLINGRQTVTPDAVTAGTAIRSLDDVRQGTVVARSRVGRRIGLGASEVRDNQPRERRCAMPATYYAGEDKVPDGTFH